MTYHNRAKHDNHYNTDAVESRLGTITNLQIYSLWFEATGTGTHMMCLNGDEHTKHYNTDAVDSRLGRRIYTDHHKSSNAYYIISFSLYNLML